MQKIRTHHNHPTGKIFSKLVLITGFGIGLILPIFPTFVHSIIPTDLAVSIFYAAMAIVIFTAALTSTIVFKKIRRTQITKTSLMVAIGIYLSLTIVTEIGELAILETLRVWFNLFLLMTLTLFVRDFTKAQNLGEQEGAFYRYNALGLLFGPLVGGFLATLISYEFVFVIAALTLTLGLLYFYHLHIIQKHPAIVNAPQKTSIQLFKNIKTFFESRERTHSYMVTVCFMIWISFKHLYIPLYIITSGYLESLSGIILALSIVPLILMEAKVGKYADAHGVKLPITLGFSVMSLIMLIVFLSPFTFLNFFLLAMVNIGGSMVEPLQEFYLFKNMPENEENNLYGVYMTSDPIAYFLTPTIGALTIGFLSFEAIFAIFGFLFALAAVFSWTHLKN